MWQRDIILLLTTWQHDTKGINYSL